MARVTMLQTQYSSDHGGRLWAGSVVDLDDNTALRWDQMGVARLESESVPLKNAVPPVLPSTPAELRKPRIPTVGELVWTHPYGAHSTAYSSSVLRGTDPSYTPSNYIPRTAQRYSQGATRGRFTRSPIGPFPGHRARVLAGQL